MTHWIISISTLRRISILTAKQESSLCVTLPSRLSRISTIIKTKASLTILLAGRKTAASLAITGSISYADRFWMGQARYSPKISHSLLPTSEPYSKNKCFSIKDMAICKIV